MHFVLVALACIVGTIIVLMVGFVGLAYLIVKEEDFPFENWERRHGLRNNE